MTQNEFAVSHNHFPVACSGGTRAQALYSTERGTRRSQLSLGTVPALATRDLKSTERGTRRSQLSLGTESEIASRFDIFR
jgi:hypothetical protein